MKSLTSRIVAIALVAGLALGTGLALQVIRFPFNSARAQQPPLTEVDQMN